MVWQNVDEVPRPSLWQCDCVGGRGNRDVTRGQQLGLANNFARLLAFYGVPKWHKGISPYLSLCRVCCKKMSIWPPAGGCRDSPRLSLWYRGKLILFLLLQAASGKRQVQLHRQLCDKNLRFLYIITTFFSTLQLPSTESDALVQVYIFVFI